MNFLYIFIFFICFNTFYSRAQDTNIFKYMPLQIGNVWVYKWTHYQSNPYINDSGFYRVSVSNTFVANGKTYFTFDDYYNGNNMCTSNFGQIFLYQYLRIDSVTGNIMAYTPGQGCSYSPDEKTIDSLKISLNDTLWYCWTNFAFCWDTSSQLIFGLNKQSKAMGRQGVESGQSKRFVKDIGLSEFRENLYIFFRCEYTLKGCVINGVLYGDTNVYIGISKISSEVPKSFSLYQNYPNPFNPSTKIRFDISKTPLNPPFSQRGEELSGGGFVTFIIYDILGREIQILVNEQLSPGTYEVEFDGTNYPSGVYYYTLTTEYFKETKRMVLVK